MHFKNTALLGLTAAATLTSLSAPLASQGWSRAFYDPTRPTRAEATAAHPDGGLAIATTLDGRFTAITKLDRNGNPAWTTAYDGLSDSTDSFFDVDVDALRRIVAVGQRDGTATYNVLDADTGHLLDSKALNDSDGGLLGVTATSDGGFVTCGFIESFRGDADIVIAKFDRFGEVVFQHQLTVSVLPEFGDDIVPMGDGFLLVGRTRWGGPGGHDLLLVGLDSNGEVTWSRAIGTPGTDALEGRPTIAAATGGGYFVTAGRDVTQLPDDDVWLLRLDAGGAVVWERTFGLGIDAPRALCATADGGCAILATTRHVADEDLWVLKVDAAGTPQWQRRLATDNRDFATDIAQTADGSLCVTARTAGMGTGGAMAAWTVRLDATGNLGSHCRSLSVVSTGGEAVQTQSIPVHVASAAITDSASLEFVFAAAIRTEQTARCATNAPPWTDLGNGTAGRDGVPELAAVGRLRPAEYFAVIAHRARPGSAASLIMGPTSVNLPLLGITLVPLPELVFASPQIPSHGSHVFEFRWPIGLPTGWEVYTQLLVLDSDAPQGIAASNAVRGRAP